MSIKYRKYNEDLKLNLLEDPPPFCDDCFNIFPALPDASFDMILCDLPYSITRNSWDNELPLEDYVLVGEQIFTFSELNQMLWAPWRYRKVKQNAKILDLLNLPMSEIVSFWRDNKLPGLWSHYKRLIKPHGVIILFGAGMFSAELMGTAKELWRYNIIWEKNHPTGFLNANKMPLRRHEDILIFYKALPVYHPQKSTGHPRKVSTAKHKRNSKVTTNYGNYNLSTYDSTERFPTSIWTFPTDKEKSSIHPTQKPVELLEQLIKTYTDEGMIILDNCAGSFTTAVACDNLNRNWVAIEKEREYFQAGLDRVNENRKLRSLPPVAEKKLGKTAAEVSAGL